MKGEGIVFWVWSPEGGDGIVEVCPSVLPRCSRWGVIVRNDRGSRSRAGLGLISMSVFDNVPFVLPGLTLDGPKLEEFPKVYNLIMRVETAFEEEIVVDLEYGQERRRGGGGALDDRVDEFHFIWTEAREFWDRGRRRETEENLLASNLSRRLSYPGCSWRVWMTITRHYSRRMRDYEDMFGPPR